jgi:2',5'-phosphodiesterase
MNSTPNTALVIHTVSSPVVSIDLFVVVPGKPAMRKSMARPHDEPAVKTIERMRMLFSIDGGAARAKGRKVTREDILKECPPIVVFGRKKQNSETTVGNNDKGEAAATAPTQAESFSCSSSTAEEILDESRLNGVFWMEAALIRIGSTEVAVHYNAPSIMSLTAPSELQVGVPAAVTNVRVLFSSLSSIEYEWIIRSPVKAASSQLADRVVCCAKLFVPSPEHLGMIGAVRCRPAGPDTAWTESVLGPVAPPRPPMPRWAVLPTPTSASFRVVSYNVLHQDFCSTKHAKTRLYPFASEEVLAAAFRQGRVAEELLTYRGDIVCLQEMGKDAFDKYYFPVLEQHGYDGALAVKMGKAREGCAVLYKTERFELVTPFEALPLTMATLRAQCPELAAEIESKHVHLTEALSKVISVAQFAVFRDRRTSDRIIVSNTHLFFHANGCHIRGLQAYIVMQRLSEIAREIEASGDGAAVSVVAAGDFNFTSVTGGYELFTRGVLDPTNSCWDKGGKFWWGCDKLLGLDGLQEELEEAVSEEAEETGAATTAPARSAVSAPAAPSSSPSSSLVTAAPPADLVVFRPSSSLSTPLRLRNSHENESTLVYSHYAIAFKAVIDHIFVSPSVKVVATLPAPSEKELSANVALPSTMYPSDHIALVADLETKA